MHTTIFALGIGGIIFFGAVATIGMLVWAVRLSNRLDKWLAGSCSMAWMAAVLIYIVEHRSTVSAPYGSVAGIMGDVFLFGGILLVGLLLFRSEQRQRKQQT